jgi:hypothetical protein
MQLIISRTPCHFVTWVGITKTLCVRKDFVDYSEASPSLFNLKAQTMNETFLKLPDYNSTKLILSVFADLLYPLT